MCLYPKIIKNRKYTSNKKNGGIIPPLNDNRALYVPVKCGKCMECMKQKSREWSIRMQEEIRNEKHAVMVTLTFSNESIRQLINGEDLKGKKITEPIKLDGYNLDNEIATIATRRFLERWRKEHKKSVRHWLVTELGGKGTENIHMHGIIWTNKKEDIEKIWQYGYVTLGTYVNERTINYIVKYINKVDKIHEEYQPKILTSAGIGRGYIKRYDSKKNKYNGNETKETYTTRQGTQIALPTYYRNAIYTDEEKERLWIKKLDEETRYVGGEKIDISKGEDNYYKALEYYRIKNKRLGYGDDSKNWDRKRYENERRNMNYKKRLKGKGGENAT